MAQMEKCLQQLWQWNKDRGNNYLKREETKVPLKKSFYFEYIHGPPLTPLHYLRSEWAQ